MARLCLIDLSGIFRAAWHASEHDEVSAAFNRTVSTVTTSSAGYDHVAICIDRPPYKRKEMFPAYKAHREKAPAAMGEQLRKVVEQLDADGFHIVGADGYEADDIIGTIVEWAKAHGHQTDVHSADKDLLQLVGEGVAVVSTRTRERYETDEEVKAKFGVAPELVADWLALAGDSSDGIPGIKGCGPKTAAAWLNEIGPLDVILQNVDKLPERFREVVKTSAEQISLSWRLAQLMLDAPINPEGIMQNKERKDAPAAQTVSIEDEPEIVYTNDEPANVVTMQKVDTKPTEEKPTAMVPASVEGSWDKALEPRSPGQAWGIANALYKSRLFGSFPNAEAILAIVMTGRGLGLDSVTSLRLFDLIEGKPAPKAQLLIGLVKKSSECEFFRLVHSDERSATFETKRRGEPEPTPLTYTYEQALAAGHVKGKDGSPKKNWRDPATMLRWRCAVALARIVYPDVISGLYAAEEMEDAA